MGFLFKGSQVKRLTSRQRRSENVARVKHLNEECQKMSVIPARRLQFTKPFRKNKDNTNFKNEDRSIYLSNEVYISKKKDMNPAHECLPKADSFPVPSYFFPFRRRKTGEK